MELLVVRHAHAGSKDRWRGDDRLRPLSSRGREEAAALVDLLAPHGPVRIVSSPLARCVQTVQPLADRIGLQLEESPALQPDSGDDAVDLLRQLSRQAGPIVVCTHGETIETLQRRLVRKRMTASAVESNREKGSVWVLRSDKGRLTSADYLPPRRAREESLAVEAPAS